ncbi:MAG: hypothetical protein K9G70_06160 [Prolixibacteraceae bacterium]|nr:hypothetical protein [Prolixibacteraceae bacterium]
MATFSTKLFFRQAEFPKSILLITQRLSSSIQGLPEPATVAGFSDEI